MNLIEEFEKEFVTQHNLLRHKVWKDRPIDDVIKWLNEKLTEAKRGQIDCGVILQKGGRDIMIEAISDRMVKISKAHKCWGCTKEFIKGTKMHRVTCKNDVVATAYWCGDCQTKIDKLYKDKVDLTDGLDFGELLEFEC